MRYTIAQKVLEGDDPNFQVELYERLAELPRNEIAEINAISFESFWHLAHSYEKENTGIIVVKASKIIAELQFENYLSQEQVIDDGELFDMQILISNTPGYIKSVGRLSAYDRFSIGAKMCNEFFEYAKSINLNFLICMYENQKGLLLYNNLGSLRLKKIPYIEIQKKMLK